jgi:hypothetical protein
MDDIQPPARPASGWLRRMLRKALTLAVVTVVFGWFYGWASPWAFPKSRTAGFKYGVLHGALMPLSLPALLIGEDVPIYASDNSGRSYKIGYICGINACGLVFFGAAFRRPKITSASSDKSQ